MKRKDLEKLLGVTFIEGDTIETANGEKKELKFKHPLYFTKEYQLLYIDKDTVNYFSEDESRTFSLNDQDDLAQLVSKVHRIHEVI